MILASLEQYKLANAASIHSHLGHCRRELWNREGVAAVKEICA
jgi:hypothetical protein